uniref:Secreted protein n=1 Tax=Astyanax mexicanus TaxID=7994 RepID=A0A3B1JK54_ASTMX
MKCTMGFAVLFLLPGPFRFLIFQSSSCLFACLAFPLPRGVGHVSSLVHGLQAFGARARVVNTAMKQTEGQSLVSSLSLSAEYVK